MSFRLLWPLFVAAAAVKVEVEEEYVAHCFHLRKLVDELRADGCGEGQGFLGEVLAPSPPLQPPQPQPQPQSQPPRPPPPPSLDPSEGTATTTVLPSVATSLVTYTLTFGNRRVETAVAETSTTSVTRTLT